MKDVVNDHQLHVCKLINKAKSKLDPRYTCTGFEGSVDLASETAYVQLIIFNQENLPTDEIKKKYKNVEKELTKYFNQHALKLEFTITFSQLPPDQMTAEDYAHVIACVRNIMAYPDTIAHLQHKTLLINVLKIIQSGQNALDLNTSSIGMLHYALWPTLFDLCANNSKEYKISNDFFYSLMRYSLHIETHLAEMIDDYTNTKKEYTLIEDGQRINLIVPESIDDKIIDLTLNTHLLFRVINKNGGQPRNINQIERYKRALSSLLDLIQDRLNQSEENYHKAIIYSKAHTNCERFFSAITTNQVIGIFGIDLKATCKMFMENQGDQHEKNLELCQQLYSKYKELANKIHFIIGLYDKNIAEIKAQQKPITTTGPHGTLFSTRPEKTQPCEIENSNTMFIGSSITETVLARPSNATKECKDKAKEQAAHEKTMPITGAQKLSSRESYKENISAPSPMIGINMKGHDDILLNLSNGKDAQGHDIAYHIAPQLTDACYMLLVVGPHTIDARNLESIRNSKGRPFLKKTGHGSNGPKLFAENLIGIKKANESSRLVLAGIEMTVLGKKYKLYFPVDVLEHSAWESRQLPSIETKEYHAKMMSKVSQIRLSVKKATDEEEPRAQASLRL